MRRSGKRDHNHSAIVQAFRAMGASVLDLGSVGSGCPDILIGWRGKNFLVEIKDGDKVLSKQKLTPQQGPWISKWAGQVIVANSIEDAMTKVATAEGGLA